MNVCYKGTAQFWQTAGYKLFAKYQKTSYFVLFCLFDLILYVPLPIFQL